MVLVLEYRLDYCHCCVFLCAIKERPVVNDRLRIVAYKVRREKGCCGYTSKLQGHKLLASHRCGRGRRCREDKRFKIVKNVLLDPL